MYLIPKNIKIKREIFKGFGIIEILVMSLSLGMGYLLQSFVSNFYFKIFLFFFMPLLVFILLIPLPNGTTALKIFKKFFIYRKRQKNYKYK